MKTESPQPLSEAEAENLEKKRKKRLYLTVGISVVLAHLLFCVVVKIKSHRAETRTHTHKSGVTASTSPKKTKTRQYSVKAGDTVAKVAFAFGVSTKELMIENGLRENAELLPGQKLNIPDLISAPVATPPPTRPPPQETKLAIKGFPPGWYAGAIIKATVRETKLKPAESTPSAKSVKGVKKKKPLIAKTPSIFELELKECSVDRLRLRKVVQRPTHTTLVEYELPWAKFPDGVWNVVMTPTEPKKTDKESKYVGTFTVQLPQTREEAATATALTCWQTDKTFGLPWHELRLELITNGPAPLTARAANPK